MIIFNNIRKYFVSVGRPLMDTLIHERSLAQRSNYLLIQRNRMCNILAYRCSDLRQYSLFKTSIFVNNNNNNICCDIKIYESKYTST